MRALTVRRPTVLGPTGRLPRAAIRLTGRGRWLFGGSCAALVLGAAGAVHLLAGLGAAGLAACALAEASLRGCRRAAVGHAAVGPVPAVRDDGVTVRYAYAPLAAAPGGHLPLIQDELRDASGEGGRTPLPLPASAGWEATTPPLPRGVWRLGPPRAVYVDPARLAECTAVAAASSGTAVTVRPAALPALPWLADIAAAHGSGALRPDADEAFEIHGIRGYAPGDDLRLIDWRSSLRTRRFHVRELSGGTAGPVAVLLDAGTDDGTGPDLGEERFETAVDCAASVAVNAVRLGLPVTLPGLPGDEHPRIFTAVPESADELLDALAAVRPAPGRPVAPLIRQAAATSGGALAVLVTTRTPDPWLPALAALSARYAEVLALTVPGATLSSAAPSRPRGFQLAAIHELAELAALTRWSAR